MQQSGLIGK